MGGEGEGGRVILAEGAVTLLNYLLHSFPVFDRVLLSWSVIFYALQFLQHKHSRSSKSKFAMDEYIYIYGTSNSY